VGAPYLTTLALFDADEFALFHVKLFIIGKNPLVESAPAQRVGFCATLALLFLEFS
jgi:hypothetical protein